MEAATQTTRLPPSPRPHSPTPPGFVLGLGNGEKIVVLAFQVWLSRRSLLKSLSLRVIPG